MSPLCCKYLLHIVNSLVVTFTMYYFLSVSSFHAIESLYYNHSCHISTSLFQIIMSYCHLCIQSHHTILSHIYISSHRAYFTSLFQSYTLYCYLSILSCYVMYSPFQTFTDSIVHFYSLSSPLYSNLSCSIVTSLSQAVTLCFHPFKNSHILYSIFTACHHLTIPGYHALLLPL